jgi:hypothetical protein
MIRFLMPEGQLDIRLLSPLPNEITSTEIIKTDPAQRPQQRRLPRICGPLQACNGGGERNCKVFVSLKVLNRQCLEFHTDMLFVSSLSTVNNFCKNPLVAASKQSKIAIQQVAQN